MITYTKTAMFFHWITALLIVGAFFLGVTMVDMHGFSPTKLRYFSWHKWLGVTILGVSCLRLLWRLSHRPPAYAGNLPAWQSLVASGLQQRKLQEGECMRKLSVVILALIFTFMAVPTYAQSAKSTVMALEKLEARCASGVS